MSSLLLRAIVAMLRAAAPGAGEAALLALLNLAVRDERCVRAICAILFFFLCSLSKSKSKEGNLVCDGGASFDKFSVHLAAFGGSRFIGFFESMSRFTPNSERKKPSSIDSFFWHRRAESY